ncbi:MAG: O-antigen ligase family protein [Alphaproteobacteria bacterium]|nr:O-antigen ligase family protein [Alphaproteobacteria bacterium]
MITSLRLAVVPILLVLCLTFGGASAAGYFSNMLLQLLALPIIAWALIEARGTPLPRAGRQLLGFAVALLVLIVLQIIPLPPSVWTNFPGRGEIISGYQALGMGLPWLPISTTPYLTVASALWLLPALAVLLATVRLGAFRPAWIAWTLLGVVAAGTAMGALQRAGSDTAYLYEITNYGVATGFFSNANHFGTLLVVTIPFLAALYVVARGKSRRASRQASALMVILAGAGVLVVVGVAINGSLAALGLSVPVIAASGLMVLSLKRRLPIWSIIPIIAVAAGGLLLVFSGPLGNNLTAADARISPVSRYTSFSNTIEAARDFFPLGSGIGSFKTIYPMYEEPSTLTTTYVNHTHSDYLELALETGVPGLLLIGLFLIWWAWRVVAVWRSEEEDHFARAATIASAAILAHSVVDYPLRTAAISAVFAICCAMMAETRPWVRIRDQDRADKARHLSAD